MAQAPKRPAAAPRGVPDTEPALMDAPYVGRSTGMRDAGMDQANDATFDPKVRAAARPVTKLKNGGRATATKRGTR
jgi:hypothetical protein